MKKILYFTVAILLPNISCSSSDNREEEVLVVDYSKAPSELKGNWKVDYHALASDPTWTASNNGGYFLKFSDDNLVSYKDSYIGATNEKGEYKNFNSGFSINIMFNKVQITTKPSTLKPGYTEFKIYYPDASDKSTILFAKKQ